MSVNVLVACTRSDMDHTVSLANNTISAFTHKHSPGGASTHICTVNAWFQLTTHLLTPRGWMAELAMLADIQQTVYSEEVTRQLHVMAQARESSPVIDWRSNQLRLTYYSFIDPKRMSGWVGHVGWHTADGLPQEVTRQLHIMAQARESSLVIDRRSNQLRLTYY